RPPAEPDSTHPLLTPLARAQDAVARLEARAEAASPAVAEGLRARMSYREAAGWLAHAHIWIHPQDLALRDANLTGSYGAAARRGRLEDALPATAAHRSGFDAIPSDVAVNLALRLARLERRLAEFRTWVPLADADAMRETLQSLGYGAAITDAEAEQWLASAHSRGQEPALIRTGRAARDWMNRRSGEPLSPDGIFFAACLWREKGFGQPISLPFWAAPGPRHHRLSLQVGLRWMTGFLECVAAAALVAGDELGRLQAAEEKGRALTHTARSRLPAAMDAVLRAPIVTARGLARSLDVTPQAALGLVRELVEAGIIREATGRASWRAFALL
ncbi:MAG: helix-turn-helix domain-containing protein, partial [Acetobacteraceae bacterium]